MTTERRWWVCWDEAAQGFAGRWDLAGVTQPLHFPMPEWRGSSIGVSAPCFEWGIKHGSSLHASRSHLMTVVWTKAWWCIQHWVNNFQARVREQSLFFRAMMLPSTSQLMRRSKYMGMKEHRCQGFVWALLCLGSSVWPRNVMPHVLFLLSLKSSNPHLPCWRRCKA